MAERQPNRGLFDEVALRRFKVIIAAHLLVLLVATLGSGASVNRTEYQIKAAFLLNFARFIDWPAAPSGGFDPLNFCVLGRDPFGSALEEAMEGQSVHGQPVQVRRIADVSELSSCQAVFLPGSEMYRSDELIKALSDRSVLTVGEAKDFALRGGVINFVMQEGKVRFQINPAAAARAHLKINFRLLQLAVIVRRGSDAK